MRRIGAVAVLLASIVLSVGVPAATPAATPEEQLAARYAPIVALKEQAQPCDSQGEPYRPVSVDVVLGRPDVRLVDAGGHLITTGPTAADLFGRGEDTYLDLPGNPLKPGCTYEQWANEISSGTPTTAYARIVTEPGKPGKLALQYWFYYVFNDFNNKHESDWEMIQLMFDASTPAEALQAAPDEVGYSQHSGAERAAWDDPKLAKQGTHPIVYPGKGSHANYFEQALWLGHGAQEGFGCDDTRAPSRLVQTHVVLLPTRAPTSAGDPFAWLAYDGHWGQKASGPNNGPTGPNTKTQWTQPVTWAEDSWRSSSAAVPLQKTLGTTATGFFCGAVAYGSGVYLDFIDTPWLVLGVLVAVVALGLWLSRRTRWSPPAVTPIDRSRSAGQIYRSGWRIYRSRWRVFLGIGLVFLVLSVLAALVQELVLGLTGLGALVSVASSDPVASGLIALGFGQLATLIATVVVTAAVAVSLERIGAGAPLRALHPYRRAKPYAGALAWAWLRIVVIVGLLSITVVGIPIAVVYLVRKAVVTQACVLEGLGTTGSLRRSTELVRGQGLRVFAITALVNVTAYLAGPILGVGVLFLTSSSLVVINVISSLVYVVVMPYVGVALALLFYDLRRRPEAEPATSGATLAPSAPA